MLIWAWQEPEKLSRRAREVVEDTNQTIYFSPTNIWEVALKMSRGKLRLETTINDFIEAQFEDHLELLPIRLSHIVHIASLPWHHRDPFDRMLIAQAMEEDLQLITADARFAAYPVSTLW